MKKTGVLPILALAAILLPVHGFEASNIALGKNVTLNGTFFTGGWGGGLVVSPQTITDGIFFPSSTQWDQGAVWWDSFETTGQNILIDLNGTFSISSFIVQADDNDAYDLYYRNGLADPWHTAWNIPPIYYYGMQTRPNPMDDTEQYFLSSPITATDLMITGNPDSDLYYSVSEVQAFGVPIPEPSISAMVLAGLGLLGYTGCFRRR